jgi:hypothetical protein
VTALHKPAVGWFAVEQLRLWQLLQPHLHQRDPSPPGASHAAQHQPHWPTLHQHPCNGDSGNNDIIEKAGIISLQAGQ